MIAGLGALTVGGGAVFGSGAFTTQEAERGLQVEVVRGDSIAEDALDVQIDAGDEDVDLSSGTPNGLFPDDSANVSLIENDVDVEFGQLVGSATATFDEFFEIINDPESGALDLTLETDGSVFTITDTDGNEYNRVEVPENASGSEGAVSDTADLTIDTEDAGNGTVNETLTITIEESTA